MKILAIGDFHGSVPIFLSKITKREQPDLIISQGDFCGNERLNKLIFKYAYAKKLELWQAIGKKRAKQLELKSLRAGEKVARYLNELNLPVFATAGNWDPCKYQQIAAGKSKWKFYNKDLFTPMISKYRNLKITDFKTENYKNCNIIGYPRSSCVDWTFRWAIAKKPKLKRRIKLIKKQYHQRFEKLAKLFRKSKNVIFISHNCPYRTRLDKVKDRKAHKLVKGKHYGSYLTKNIIRKFQPALCICGHMHENQGVDRIGKTLIVNPGAAKSGRYALININEKGKIKIKLRITK